MRVTVRKELGAFTLTLDPGFSRIWDFPEEPPAMSVTESRILGVAPGTEEYRLSLTLETDEGTEYYVLTVPDPLLYPDVPGLLQAAFVYDPETRTLQAELYRRFLLDEEEIGHVTCTRADAPPLLPEMPRTEAELPVICLVIDRGIPQTPDAAEAVLKAFADGGRFFCGLTVGDGAVTPMAFGGRRMCTELSQIRAACAAVRQAEAPAALGLPVNAAFDLRDSMAVPEGLHVRFGILLLSDLTRRTMDSTWQRGFQSRLGDTAIYSLRSSGVELKPDTCGSLREFTDCFLPHPSDGREHLPEPPGEPEPEEPSGTRLPETGPSGGRRMPRYLPAAAAAAVILAVTAGVLALRGSERPAVIKQDPPERSTVAGTSKVYTVVTGKYSWEEAEAYCREHGGSLATVHSEEEWRRLVAAAEETKQSREPMLRYLWIGGRTEFDVEWLSDPQTKREAVFSWADGSETDFITGRTEYWFLNGETGLREPTGYDTVSYRNGSFCSEDCVMLWNAPPDADSDETWSLTDISGSAGLVQFRQVSMGFVMETGS